MGSDGMIQNAMATLLVLYALGLPIADYLERFSTFQSFPKILRRLHYDWEGKTFDVIDDTHNASIPAMLDAIATFNHKSQFYIGKKVFVAGQVADLGKSSEALHQELFDKLQASQADSILGYGAAFEKSFAETDDPRCQYFKNLADLETSIVNEVTQDAYIFLKGSVSHSDFHQISNRLKKRFSNQ
jgi:UDP-N-acetylmuramoyl-tripeptide--D-alanyl-D-alanine ligase